MSNSGLTTTLEREDWLAIDAALPRLYGANTLATFPLVSLRLLNQLLPSTCATYNEVDLRTQATRILREPEEAHAVEEKDRPRFLGWTYQPPLMSRDGQSNKGSHSSNGRHPLEVYRQMLEKMDRTGDTLAITVHASRTLEVFFSVIGRLRFSERDRAVMVALRPHLRQAFENALSSLRCRGLALLSAQTVSDVDHLGVFHAAGEGHIVHADANAMTHLCAAFPESSCDRLPALVLAWFARIAAAPAGERLPLEIRAGDRTFILRAAPEEPGHWMVVIRESHIAQLTAQLASRFRLTAREADVFYWVSRGKSNSEIAVILAISHRTVDKHIEHIFRKVGVENRTTAILRAVEVIGVS